MKDTSVQVQVVSSLGFRSSTLENLQIEDPVANLATGALPPDGASTGLWPVKVVDQNNNPVSGVPVSFTVTYISPGQDWRTRQGIVNLYNSTNGNGVRAGQKVDNGEIRPLCTVNRSPINTDANGVAQVEIRASHIASDFAQTARGREKVTATIPGGSTTELLIDVGWTGLIPIVITAGGLIVDGATGRHVHPEIGEFLKNLGAAVVDAHWPHPIVVTAASLQFGGLYPPHFSHKLGVTLDLRPMSTDGAGTWAKQDGTHAANYDFQRTKAVIKVLRDSGAPIVNFNGKDAGGTPLAGHDNHIHVSWVSSEVPQISKLTNRGREELLALFEAT